MTRQSLRLGILSTLLFAVACRPVGGGGSTTSLLRQDGSGTTIGAKSNRVGSDELRTLEDQSLEQALLRIRPAFLRLNPSGRARPGSSDRPGIYIDNSYVGAPEVSNATEEQDASTKPISLYTPFADRSRRYALSVLDGGRVALRYAASTELLLADAIVLARAEGNFTLLVTEASEHLVRAPLTFVVEELKPFGLVRIHRGAAVNMGRVQRVVARGQHKLFVVLRTGAEVEVGRNYQRLIRDRLGVRTQR